MSKGAYANVEWEAFTTELTPGEHTLTWSYTYTEEEEVTIPVEGEDSGEGGTEPASESTGTTTTIVVNEVTEEREETRDLEFQKEY